MKKFINLILLAVIAFLLSCTTTSKLETPKIKKYSSQEKIIKAVKANDMAALKVLVDPADDVKTLVDRNTLLLHMAVESAVRSGAPYPGMVEYLVKKKAYVCQLNSRRRSISRIIPGRMCGSPLDQYIRSLNLGEKFKLYRDGIRGDSKGKLKEFFAFAPPSSYMLLDAAKYNSIAVAKFLVDEKKVSVNSTDRDGQNALYKIVSSYRHGHSKKPIITWAERMKLAEYLLDRGIDVNKITKRQKRTPLAKLLSQPIGTRDAGSKEPFALMLIEHGADIKALDKMGLSILAFAVSRNYKSIISILDKKGVDFNDKLAIGRISKEETLDFFIKKGVSHEAVINRFCLIKNNEKQVKALNTLIRNGLDVKKIRYFNVFLKNMDALKLLGENGANIADSKLILSAVYSNDIELVKFIVESKGFDINKQYYHSGFMIIHRAAREKNREIVKYLVSKGADINSKDNRGRTPLSCVRDREFKEFLKSMGAK